MKSEAGIQERLAELDVLRYTEPALVIAEIADRMDELPFEFMAEALGIRGSAHRVLHDHSTAQEFIEQGLEFADQLGDHSTAGKLHQRLSMVFWHVPDYKAAFSENCKAIARHEDAGNPVCVATAMVDRGVILGSMGDFSWSTRAFQRALEGLPKKQFGNRFTAYQGIGHNFLETKEPTEAIPYLAAAEKIPVTPSGRFKLTWTYGCALSWAGWHRQAIEKLSSAAEFYLLSSPIESALVTIDLAKSYIRAGRPIDAYTAARSMHQFIGHLKRNKVAMAAATELSNIGREGNGLNFAVLNAVRKKVRTARA